MPFTFPSAHQNPVNSMIWSWNHFMFILSEFLGRSGSRGWTRGTWSSPPPIVSVCSSDIHPASTACHGSGGGGSFPGGSEGKVSACSAGDLGSIPGSGRSPGEGNGNPLQYSCLENPMDGGAWQTTVHGIAKSRT